MRFAPEFETSLDDWKPDFKDPTINLCTVSEGTYEVCSRTVAGHPEKGRTFSPTNQYIREKNYINLYNSLYAFYNTFFCKDFVHRFTDSPKHAFPFFQ